ncbi:MAG TPA: phosphate acyltransferase PlsX [Elusimicrobiales bacterium]|nr:phosphate acyltransferase PlsX [Elusimicrobiales bacterium]
MRIALDVHGGDFGLKPNIDGALQALEQLPHEIILVGRDPEIREELRGRGVSPSDRLRIVHAQQIVEMGREPVEECRSKPDSSLMVGVELVRDGKADAFISAGNSGAVMVASLLKLKRIPGIIRPALAAPYPTFRGTTLLLDVGANMDSKPWHLVQFAVMGSIFMKLRFGIENPSVGLLSIGEEETKGNSLTIETIPLMKSVGVNFHGPVEGGDVPSGTTDVVVTDGFAGNVALKLSEGLAATIFKLIRQEIHRRFTYKIGALLMKKVFTGLRRKMDVDEYGGAPLLGVNGVVLICHGRTNQKAIFSAVKTASDLVGSGMLAKIKEEMSRIKDRISGARTANEEARENI